MGYKLPLVDLQRQYDTIRPEIQQAIDKVLQRSDFILGQAVDDFEAAFASFCGVRHVIGVASGTAAIHMVLCALDIKTGDEVITVPHTFVATAEPIVYCGARPVFVDVHPEDFTLDPDKLEDAITPRTRAIIPVHLYGQCANMEPILETAWRHDIPVIEDAAQAQGATYHGSRAGSLALAGCFSFYPGKNLGAYGDAGAVTTNDAELAQRVHRLRNHGRVDKYEHLEVGYGERLDTLQAAILQVKLSKLLAWNELRRRWADCYREALSDIPDVQLPRALPQNGHVYHQFVIRTRRRDALAEHLKRHGIQTGIHYPIPLHLQPAFRDLGYTRGAFPVAERLADTVLSLPLFPEMTESEVLLVADTVRSFFLR